MQIIVYTIRISRDIIKFLYLYSNPPQCKLQACLNAQKENSLARQETVSATMVGQ